MSRFSIEAVFKAIDQISAPVTRMQNSIGKMTRSIDSNLNAVNRRVDKITSGIKTAAFAIVSAMAVSGVAMADVINTGMQFEQTIVNAAAKFPGAIKKGSAAFAELEAAARKTGATTEFTAVQSAEALNSLAAAGLSASGAIASLPFVVDMATAAQMELGSATDIVADSLGAFGLMTEDTAQLVKNLARVNDVFALTANKSTISVEQIYQSMKKAGPIATAAGASIETVSSMLGVMANSGIKAELAGTAVANMFLNLTSPSTAAQGAMKKLGISILDSKKNLKDMPTILDDINKATSGMTKANKLSILETIFGREGLAGAASMVSAGGDALREFRSELENATGSSAKMAATMRDTLQGRFNSLKSAIESVKISIFSLTNESLSKAVDKTTEWVRANEKLIATKVGDFLVMIIDNFESIVIWTKNIAIGLAVFFTFVAVLKTFVLVMTVINILMAMNPIGLMVIGVIALIAGLALVVTYAKELWTWFSELPLLIKLMVGPIGWIVSAIVGAIALMKDGIKYVVENAAKIGGLFGMGDNESPQSGGSQVVSPQARTARSIEETRTSSSADVTIRDETGRAAVTRGTLGSGVTLTPSGAF